MISSSTQGIGTPHSTLITLLLPVEDPSTARNALQRIQQTLATVPHEVIALYAGELGADLDAFDVRRPTLRMHPRGPHSLLAASATLAGGDVVIALDPDAAMIALAPALAAAVRRGLAIAIAPTRLPDELARAVDAVLAFLAGTPTWNSLSGYRAYQADFLARHAPTSPDDAAADLQLLFAAQVTGAPAGVADVPPLEQPPRTFTLAALLPPLRQILQAPLLVYTLWLVMTLAAAVTVILAQRPPRLEHFIDVAFPSAAVIALTLAVRRVRGRVRIADAFFSLVLLNPLFFARVTGGLDPTLVSGGLLGLMAGAIIAMKRDKLRRYLAVAALAIGLTFLADTFVMLLPAIFAWLFTIGFRQVRAPAGRERTQGFIILAAAHLCLLAFGYACVLLGATTTPSRTTLFATIVSFAEFPLLVLTFILLALGWRPAMPEHAPALHGSRPRKIIPPYFSGMLALLVGLLTMLLNNFQSGALPPPGADQTALILCLLYTVSALHAPRRLHYLLPPLLLAAAIAYTLFRWHNPLTG